jgi:hypothetical protein
MTVEACAGAPTRRRVRVPQTTTEPPGRTRGQRGGASNRGEGDENRAAAGKEFLLTLFRFGDHLRDDSKHHDLQARPGRQC